MKTKAGGFSPKWIIIIIGVVLLAVLLITQVIFPVSIKTTTVSVHPDEIAYEAVVSNAERVLNGDKDTMVPIGFTKELPSDNADDYYAMEINLTLSNKSVLTYNVAGCVDSVKVHADNLLFSNRIETQVLRTDLDPFGEATAWFLCWIYVGDLSESEIEEMVKSITLKINLKGYPFGSETLTVSLGELKDLSITYE